MGLYEFANSSCGLSDTLMNFAKYKLLKEEQENSNKLTDAQIRYYNAHAGLYERTDPNRKGGRNPGVDPDHQFMTPQIVTEYDPETGRPKGNVVVVPDKKTGQYFTRDQEGKYSPYNPPPSAVKMGTSFPTQGNIPTAPMTLPGVGKKISDFFTGSDNPVITPTPSAPIPVTSAPTAGTALDPASARAELARRRTR